MYDAKLNWLLPCQAARMLGISKQRVHQLVNVDLLYTEVHFGVKMINVESIVEYNRNRRKPIKETKK